MKVEQIVYNVENRKLEKKEIELEEVTIEKGEEFKIDFGQLQQIIQDIQAIKEKLGLVRK